MYWYIIYTYHLKSKTVKSSSVIDGSWSIQTYHFFLLNNYNY